MRKTRHMHSSCTQLPHLKTLIVFDVIVRRERLGGLIQWYETAA